MQAGDFPEAKRLMYSIHSTYASQMMLDFIHFSRGEPWRDSKVCDT
jgi:hypothetical protein